MAVITVTTILLCFILGLLDSSACSRTGAACCTRYSRKPVPFQRIKGYREQSGHEKCRLNAIIFYTVKKNEICATRKDEWVRRTLDLLSSKLKKMSKISPAEGEEEKRNIVN
ncbi:C-C motif chemokine 20-like isoform X2 [Thalassophryne amazonica]|uniref:C-C motif chemokine 20-like isoform X2 n=1 Tax=Thalassophryne amazonica TaxID=390379 RepID=UPI00147258A1|nr:C-C motif chemokine 20-like isoform X2 [Thalassophryne amazonica]